MKKYRKKIGISQDVLSKRANLAFHTIAKIEAGSTSDPRLKPLKKSQML
jgi:predicted transcriptional regulator